ncbi:hypothetical protein [Bradyrhizobium sp. JR18.2]|uniref:hypothetical protein n=1 Tax=Bradyrhizobium sp. JR18.2 TaxID=3156369 RepID=UPI003390EE95
MTQQTEDYLRKMYLRSKDTVGKLGGRIEKAEREVRDITKDRDHWRERALKAEAALASSPLSSNKLGGE